MKMCYTSVTWDVLVGNVCACWCFFFFLSHIYLLHSQIFSFSIFKILCYICLNHFGCVCSDESLVEESRTFESRFQSLLHDTIQESESSMEVQHPHTCHDAKQLSAVVYWVFPWTICGKFNKHPTPCCPRCWASGRGCVEARISPVTSLELSRILCLPVVLYCLRVDVISNYMRCV